MHEKRTLYVFHESNFTNDDNVAFENRAKKEHIENKGQKSKQRFNYCTMFGVFVTWHRSETDVKNICELATNA